MSRLADHFDEPYHRGECERPTHGAESKLEIDSGCQLRFELAINDEAQVLEAWWDGSGCMACEGFSSIVSESIEGKQVEDIDVKELLQLGKTLSLEEMPEEDKSECVNLVLETMGKALTSSFDELDDDLTNGTQFGGPSLREEC